MKKVHAELGPGAVIVSTRVVPDPQYPEHPFYEVIARAPTQGTMMAIQSLRAGQPGGTPSGRGTTPTPPPGQQQRVAGGALRSVQHGQNPPTTARHRGQPPPTKVRQREQPAPPPEPARGPASPVGGLEKQLAAIREVVVLPIEYPEMFERLGIDAPKGVLMHRSILLS